MRTRTLASAPVLVHFAAVSPPCGIAIAFEEKLDATPLADFAELLRPVVNHALHEGCSDCARAVARLNEIRVELMADPGWGELWPDESALARQATLIARKLISQPPPRRRMYVFSSPAAQTRTVVEALITESKAYLSRDAAHAVEIAEVALLCADSISPSRYEEPLLFDLQAKALANLANAQRRSGDLRAAAGTIEEAEAAMLLGSGAPEILGYVLTRKVRLLRDQQRHDQALEEIGFVIELYRAPNLGHLLGRAFYERSAILSDLGRNDEAISDLHSALTYLDPSRSARLRLNIAHSLAVRYHQAGRSEQALVYLDLAARSAAADDNPGDQIRITWARGRVWAAACDLDAARADFTAARDGFLALDYALDAAIVTLELAVILAKVGRFREVAELATEMHATFEAVGAPGQATAALLLLREARTVEAVRDVAATVSRLKSSSSASDRVR